MENQNDNDSLDRPVPYDVGVFIANYRKIVDEENGRNPINSVKYSSHLLFKEAVRLIEGHFDSIFDTNDTRRAQEGLQMQHDAIIGITTAVNYFKDEITDFLRKNNLLKVPYPEYYRNLSDGIFHDLFGLGPLVTWYDYPASQSAHIIGTAVYFEIGQKLIRQPVEFESIDRVAELVRSLTLKDPRSRINEHNPRLEIDMVDGTRVTLFVPPLSRQISVTFRRFVVSELTFEDQAAKGTLPVEAIEFFRALNHTRPNIIIAGPVKSGKSTMLSTFYGEREHSQKVVCVEKHPELKLSDHYGGRPLDELVATEQELMRLFPSILRTDFVYLIVGELRSVEAELCMLGCERGSTGLLTTYHTKHAHNIPTQLARLILDSFPNRRFEAEVVRVAENVDIVIVMDELPDKSKRIESVVELRLDPYSLKISTHEILRYDENTETYAYRYDLSDALVRKLKKNDPLWAELLIISLKKLSESNHIKGNNVIFSTTPAMVTDRLSDS